MLPLPKKAIGTFAAIILISFAINGCALRSSPSPPFFSIHYDSLLSRNNIALIIPGLNQTCFDPGYDSIGAYYKNNGITPVYVTINWKAVGIKNLSAAASQIHHMLQDSFPLSHFYLFGFSFGAVISLKLSQLTRVEQILLCSMSPMFDEDRIHQIVPFRQLLGIVTDYSKNGLSYSASKGTCVIFLYGDHDSFVINKAIIRNRKDYFTCNETHIVPNAGHNIAGRSYLASIQRIVQRCGK
jgi:pimeloyl-ACP methyl ester carboxylesterase